MHVGLRLHGQHLFGGQQAVGAVGLEPAAPRRKGMAADDLVHRHEADVVPVVGVAGARIAEPGKQQHAGHPLAWRVPDVPGLAWLGASRARETCRTARRLSPRPTWPRRPRSDEHTSELPSLMRTSY